MRNFLVFDIGGTLLKYGVLTETGSFIEKDRTLTEAHLGGPAIIKKVKQIGKQFVEKYDISGVCISTAGQVDSRVGKILYAIPSIIPDYTGTSLKQILEEYFQLPVEVENDVNCVGLAESWLGTGKDVKSLFCLTIGTGIGGSYILDNQLHTGHSYSGGEIGYIPIEGKQFQELASTKVLIDNVAKRKGITPRDIDGKKIFELAKNGDEICIQEINQMIYYLSKGIAAIAYMMNPEMIIIGGGISEQKSYIYPKIMEQLKQDIIPAVLKNTKIKIAHYLNDAGMIGALRHFLIKESLQPLNRILTLIDSRHHQFTKSENMIANYITQNLNLIPNMTISELSQETNVSDATITRFCRKIGVDSYGNLKLLIKEAIVSKRQIEPVANAAFRDIKKTYVEMLNRFDVLYEHKDISSFKILDPSYKQFIIYCSEELALIMNQIKWKLVNYSIKADVYSTPYEINLSENFLADYHLVFGISLSGEEMEILEAIEKARLRGIKTISITRNANSNITKVSDEIILLPSFHGDEAEKSSVSEVSIYYLFDVILNEILANKHN